MQGLSLQETTGLITMLQLAAGFVLLSVSCIFTVMLYMVVDDWRVFRYNLWRCYHTRFEQVRREREYTFLVVLYSAVIVGSIMIGVRVWP